MVAAAAGLARAWPVALAVLAQQAFVREPAAALAVHGAGIVVYALWVGSRAVRWLVRGAAGYAMGAAYVVYGCAHLGVAGGDGSTLAAVLLASALLGLWTSAWAAARVLGDSTAEAGPRGDARSGLPRALLVVGLVAVALIAGGVAAAVHVVRAWPLGAAATLGALFVLGPRLARRTSRCPSRSRAP